MINLTRVLALHDALGDKKRDAQDLPLMQQEYCLVVKSSQENSNSLKNNLFVRGQIDYTFEVPNSYLSIFVASEFEAVRGGKRDKNSKIWLQQWTSQSW